VSAPACLGLWAQWVLALMVGMALLPCAWGHDDFRNKMDWARRRAVVEFTAEPGLSYFLQMSEDGVLWTTVGSWPPSRVRRSLWAHLRLPSRLPDHMLRLVYFVGRD